MDFQKVSGAIEKSSPEIKDLLFSNEIGQALQSIAENNGLAEETSLQMVDEVGYVILGLKERSSLKSSLTNIGIPKTAVVSIIQEISREIFSKLDKIETNKSSGEKNVETKPEPTKIEPNKLESPKTETDEAIIITQENKEEALKELSRRAEGAQVSATTVPPPFASNSAKATMDKQGSGGAMEIAPANLPMIEEGETVHSVPHIESTTNNEQFTIKQKKAEPQTSLPDYRYDGKDPYREPLK